MTVTRLFFYESEVRDWIWRKHQIRLPQRTCANWRAGGVIRASARWPEGSERIGTEARGGGKNMCRYTPEDFARVRLVALLRYALRLSLNEIKALMREHGAELTAILRGRSDAVLLLDPVTRKPYLRRRGAADLDLQSGQFMLDLKPLTEGNEEAARAARKIA